LTFELILVVCLKTVVAKQRIWLSNKLQT